MTRPGAVPLSALHDYTIAPHLVPEQVADRGTFYIRDGWLRPWMVRGHPGREVVYVIDFETGEKPAARFALEWSPLREQVVELVLRTGGPVGACRLVSQPFRDGVDLWVIVGVDDDGTVYNPLGGLVADGDAATPAPAVIL